MHDIKAPRKKLFTLKKNGLDVSVQPVLQSLGIQAPNTGLPALEPVLSVHLALVAANHVLTLIENVDLQLYCRRVLDAACEWCYCPCVDHFDVFETSFAPAWSAYGAAINV